MINSDKSAAFQEKRVNLLIDKDIAYIHKVMDKEFCSLEEICAILNDKELRLKLLDNEKLYRSLITNNEMLNVSSYFYYFLLCRRMMVEAGLTNPAFANNITASLVEMHRLHCNELKQLNLKKSKRYPPLYMRILVKNKSKLNIVKIRARIGQIRLVFDALVDPANHLSMKNLSKNQDRMI